MAGVIGVFVVLFVWRFFIVVGECVFAATGLPPNAAAFEARSALVGAGYTTSQSEHVVRDAAARRVASALIAFGYFGPAVVLTLLGVSFVVPTGEDLTARFVTLLVLVGGLLLLDRLGVIRALGRRPARAWAKRLVDTDPFETWVVVGDHVVATVLIPRVPERADRIAAALTSSGVKILAVEPESPGQPAFPDNAQPVEPKPGDRVVAFGPEDAFQSIRNASS